MLKRLIAHQILKEKGEKGASKLHLRKDVLPAKSDLAAQLLDHLRQSFQNGNPLGGVFKVPEENKATIPEAQQSAANDGAGFLFRPALLEYLALTTDRDRAFVDFTVRATKTLSKAIANQSLATGGYVVFLEYNASEDYLMTSLLTTQATPSFDEDLNLVAANPLDFEHLRHGARIQLKDAKANNEGVVQFFSQRAEGVSDYFVDFLGCEEMIRPDVQVRRIEQALRDYTIRFSPRKREEVMARTYGYLRNRADRRGVITVAGIANAVAPDDPKSVRRHLGNEKYSIVGRFRPPSEGVMKRFGRFTFDGEGLRLEFDRDPWVNRIRFNKAERTVTIRPAPAALIAALEKGA